MAGELIPSVIRRLFYRPIATDASGPVTVLVPGRLLMAWHWLVDRKWSELRAIGNSNASKMTVIFPIVGYLIIFNDELVKHLNLWQPMFGSPTDASPPLRLIAVYFGLIFVSVAAALYGIRCPSEIKRHQGDMDYIAEMEALASTARREGVERQLSEDAIAAPGRQVLESERRDALARVGPFDPDPASTRAAI